MAKTDMAVASAATLADAQCMAAEVIRAERVFGLCCQCHHQCSFYRRYLTLTAGVATIWCASGSCTQCSATSASHAVSSHKNVKRFTK
ncbi:hypothetical protein Bca4012_006186 [Brassica carinata]